MRTWIFALPDSLDSRTFLGSHLVSQTNATCLRLHSRVAVPAIYCCLRFRWVHHHCARLATCWSSLLPPDLPFLRTPSSHAFVGSIPVTWVAYHTGLCLLLTGTRWNIRSPKILRAFTLHVSPAGCHSAERGSPAAHTLPHSYHHLPHTTCLAGLVSLPRGLHTGVYLRGGRFSFVSYHDLPFRCRLRIPLYLPLLCCTVCFVRCRYLHLWHFRQMEWAIFTWACLPYRGADAPHR